MGTQGRLKLDLTDVLGKRLRERVDILLFPVGPGPSLKVLGIDASRSILVKGLNPPPQSIYRVFVDPPSYLPVQQFLTASGAASPPATALRFPIDPLKVVRVDFPKLGKLPQEIRRLIASAGAGAYDALDDVRRAGLLNIAIKAENTVFPNGRTVASYFDALQRVEGDRLFVLVQPDLIEEARNAVAHALLEPAPGRLHTPPPGFQRVASFKSPDHYGNLQLTFFTNGEQWMVDVDIDDANGFAHIFQVARNAIKDRATHPYDIQQILIAHQGLDPQYRLVVNA